MEDRDCLDRVGEDTHEFQCSLRAFLLDVCALQGHGDRHKEPLAGRGPGACLAVESWSLDVEAERAVRALQAEAARRIGPRAPSVPPLTFRNVVGVNFISLESDGYPKNSLNKNHAGFLHLHDVSLMPMELGGLRRCNGKHWLFEYVVSK